jgi:D-aminoacyl-tRNA deacylase
MRAVVQRIKKAGVRIDGVLKGSIDKGLLVYVGIEKGDSPADAHYLSSKLRTLRIFEDNAGKMNLDIIETGGSVLVISQFTLAGDARKGRRTSFERAEAPQMAKELYEKFIKCLTEAGVAVREGEFQAHMEVESVNDGPVTILLDSKKVF